MTLLGRPRRRRCRPSDAPLAARGAEAEPRPEFGFFASHVRRGRRPCARMSRHLAHYSDSGSPQRANLERGEARLRDCAHDNHTEIAFVPTPKRRGVRIPKDDHRKDGAAVSAAVGSLRPDLGAYAAGRNVWEWKGSTFRPYPYREDAAGASARANAGYRG
ncbi:MAG: hypothetical protein BWX69_01384 [Planctomycetes bacterium ADurb.Bin069]|nr:MAG: hypothetical protein BWX69_01384 [Planctomycetes bacterium ADurb.Bin069]